MSSAATRSVNDATAADARAKLQGLRFDLLILDVMMPGETGFDLARDLRQEAFQRARQRAQKATPRVSIVTTLVIVLISLACEKLIPGAKRDEAG